jgi:hypothetical protein
LHCAHRSIAWKKKHGAILAELWYPFDCKPKKFYPRGSPHPTTTIVDPTYLLPGATRMIGPRVFLLAFALSVALSPRLIADEAEASAFFESKIRPVLVQHCESCHSVEAKKKNKLRGGLLLDSKAGWQKGGETGPAVVPGKLDAGTVLEAIRYKTDLQMPPAGKLPEKVIADFEKWIQTGAFDPRIGEGKAIQTAELNLEKGRQFWSLQPPKMPSVPQIAQPVLPIRDPIDAFIQARWKEHGLKPVGFADPRTLLRRVTFDLTGLPPSPEDMEAFLKDPSPEAFARRVDELLARPQYGERWARHWLDVARYAEDQAHTFAVTPKTNAYLYRDWVVQAFNADMPFDEFVMLQLAGDLLPEKKYDLFTRVTGLGFLGLGAEYYKNTAREQAIAEELDDRVDVVSRAFLGLTVSCARCHDHKFDPIPTKDYYSLAGLFYGTNMTNIPLVPDEEVKAYNKAQAKIKEANETLKKAQNAAKDKKDDPKLAQAVKDAMAEVKTAQEASPKPPLAAHVLSGKGNGMKVYIRGNPATRGEDAPKGFLQVISKSDDKRGSEFSRLDLAERIATPENPLTARVIVNRVWAWHFGRGLVNTPSNFGALGDRPTHPELLDYLAVEFVNHGWSLKWLHRQILNSSVYALASVPSAENNAIDAANVYLWRGTRRRLDVEAWRDSLLAISGNLDSTLGGPTFNLNDADAKRRTLYAKISRHELNGLLRLFDFPDANVTADKRSITTVPQQQLFTLNSDFMVNQARAFADRVAKLATTDEERVVAAYQFAFNRKPTAAEQKLALSFLQLPNQSEDKLTRWQQYAQALLASNEIMYID